MRASSLCHALLYLAPGWLTWESMFLLEDVCHWGQALSFQNPMPFPGSSPHSLMPPLPFLYLLLEQKNANAQLLFKCLPADMLPVMIVMNIPSVTAIPG